MIKILQILMMLGMVMLFTALVLFVIWLNYLVLFSALGFSKTVSMIVVGAMTAILAVGSAAIIINKD